MCGIAGIVKPGAAAEIETVRRMTALMRVRGPSSAGVHATPDAVLGAARLAIVGGADGAQPMVSPSGAALVMNGEVYNWRRLARQYDVAARSDTELVLALLERNGAEKAIPLLRGGFALAYADAAAATILLARDVFGQKPLYVARRKDAAIVFASEIKALIAAGIEAQPDEQALNEYLARHFYTPGRTPFASISSLPPGQVVRVAANGLLRTSPVAASEDGGEENLGDLFGDVAALQGEREHPASLFLSGGLDSTATLGALCATGHPPERAICGAFQGAPELDERVHARRAALSFGVPLDEVLISAADFAAALSRTVLALEMPVAGPGSVAQYILCRRAQEVGPIVFGGTGGDELFGGYERIRVLTMLAAGGAVSSPGAYGPLHARMSRAPTPEEAYFAALDRRGHLKPGPRFGGEGLPLVLRRLQRGERQGDGMADRAMAFEALVLLPGLLHVDDRTAAAFSLESRSLFLDQVLASRLQAIPVAEKSPPDRPRALMREALAPFLPDVIRHRGDKMGFPVPLSAWFNGPLREFAADVLGSRRARERGIFEARQLQDLLADDGLGGRVVFGLLSLELWFQIFVDKSEPSAAGSQAEDRAACEETRG